MSSDSHKTPAEKRAEVDAAKGATPGSTSASPATSAEEQLPEHSHDQPETVTEADGGDVAPAAGEPSPAPDWGEAEGLSEPATADEIRSAHGLHVDGMDLPEPTWGMVKLLLDALEGSTAAHERLAGEVRDAIAERDRVSEVLRARDERRPDAPAPAVFDFAKLKVGQKVKYHPGGDRHVVPAKITAVHGDSVDIEYPHHADPSVAATAEGVTHGAGVYSFEV